MNVKYFIGILVLLATAALTGCGGDGDGDSVDPNAAASVTVAASKSMAVADGTDAVSLQASVTKADGTAVPDGMIVSFSANTATLSAPSAATTNGIASVSVTSAPVSGANNYTATITAASGGAQGTRDVKFINQPASVDVSINFSFAVTNLSALQFSLKNTAGASFDNNAQPISLINNAAAAQNSIQAGGFDAATNSLEVATANPSGFNTGTNPIIKATYAVVPGAGLPTFSIDTAGLFIATDPLGLVTSPPVFPSNMVVLTVFNTE